MNLVVLGEDMYTAAVIESLVKAGHRVSLLVTPDSATANFKVLEEATEKNGIAFLKTENINSVVVAEKIREIKPDLIISAHLRKILKKEIFSLAAKGAINIHPSLLPKYRGLSPQHQAIMHGDSESGVTVHFIEADVDTGDIILQKKFTIEKGDYILQVQSKMLTIYKTIVAEAVELLASGSVEPVKQDLETLSYFGPLKKSDRQVDLSKTTEEVYNLVRAVSLPYKGAFYENYTFWTAEITDDPDLKRKYADTGVYLEEAEDRIIVRLKDGLLVSEDFEINKN
ncbi:MAG TPA: methionyl-tRNA formyltransferase [Ferruginibacter sp.]|mgnify:CR=1 FL=1|nr:methionyl-tRNA formyltransferase [Ferruginibacter sp.]